MSDTISRRRFLVGTIVVAMAGIGTAIGIPALAYLVGPSRQSEKRDQWLALGAANAVELGEPSLFKAEVERTTGWLSTRQEIALYVKTDNGRDYVGMSNICTHLGCRTRWVSDRRQFYCPCHAGVFDEDGNVVSGPPPRPLDRYEVKVEEGQLLFHLA